MDADHGFPSRVKSDRLGMLLSDRHGCYYVIGMNVIERSPCVGICTQCVGAQWRCEHEVSLGLRSKHFKSLLNDGVKQVPPDRVGVVHIWYETCEGIEIEELRRGKHIENISAYDASQTTVLGVFLHAVNYYPFEDNYEWAETVQDFGCVPGLMGLFPRQSLMLAFDSTPEVENATHWGQDKAAKTRGDSRVRAKSEDPAPGR